MRIFGRLVHLFILATKIRQLAYGSFLIYFITSYGVINDIKNKIIGEFWIFSIYPVSQTWLNFTYEIQGGNEGIFPRRAHRF